MFCFQPHSQAHLTMPTCLFLFPPTLQSLAATFTIRSQPLTLVSAKCTVTLILKINADFMSIPVDLVKWVTMALQEEVDQALKLWFEKV